MSNYASVSMPKNFDAVTELCICPYNKKWNMKNLLSNRVMKIDFHHKQAFVSLDSGATYVEIKDIDLPEDNPVVQQFEVHFDSGHNLVTAYGKKMNIESHHLKAYERWQGSPVVYLDQNKWVELARVEKSVSKIPSDEQVAARKLMELCRNKKVITPLSDGHLTETSKKKGVHRIDLSTMMLQMSQGWQIEHPLEVKKRELMEVVAKRAGIPLIGAANVISLKPMHLRGEGSSRVLPSGHTSIEKLTKEYHEALFWVMYLFQWFGDDEESEQNPAQDLIEKWCADNQMWAEEFKNNSKARNKSADLTFWNVLRFEVGHELLAEYATVCGMTYLDYKDWSSTSMMNDIRKAPSLGLCMEVMESRMRNASLKWDENHYIDIQHLSNAAAYSDYVLGEKDTLAHITRSSKKVSVKAQTGTKFTDLMRFLEGRSVC